jgi:hypothetical protein
MEFKKTCDSFNRLGKSRNKTSKSTLIFLSSLSFAPFQRDDERHLRCIYPYISWNDQQRAYISDRDPHCLCYYSRKPLVYLAVQVVGFTVRYRATEGSSASGGNP